MMFHQTFFGKRPESFNAVDVDFPLFELVSVVDIEMPVSAEHKRIITALFVGVNDRTPSNFFDGFSHQGFRFYIRENTD